jgi:hypothetical protein
MSSSTSLVSVSSENCITRQSENLVIQPSFCICIPQYLSFVSVLRVCVCVCGYGGVYSEYTNPLSRLWTQCGVVENSKAI